MPGYGDRNWRRHAARSDNDPMPVPSRRLKDLIEGTVDHHASQRWPALEEVTVSWRGSYGYLTGYLSEDDDDTIELCRIQYLGDPDEWAFAIWQASTDSYADSVLLDGQPHRAPESGTRHRLHPLPRRHQRPPACTHEPLKDLRGAALGPWLERALDICASHRGEVSRQEGDPAASWRASFLRGPHLRDGLVQLGVVSETFETAVTWDHFWEFHEGVLAAARQAVLRECGGGVVTCRFAYVYPDGPAPYYSVFAPGRPGQELQQWDAIKRAASEAIEALGGTITHHHAVGRDHRPWYLRELPHLFTDALRSAKAGLDPAGILNPGVLLEPAGAITYSREGG